MNTQITVSSKLYIGIDIHKRSWKVHCATDLFSGKSFAMPSKPELLEAYVNKHFSDYEVTTAYKAGCCGYYAHRSFESYGWRSLVVNPADIHRKGKERFTKTDKIDAQLIARELKDGRLDGIHVPEVEREQLRSLFRRRNDLVKDFRRIKSIIKIQLLYFGVSVPEEFDNDHWSHNFRNWIDSHVFEHLTAREAYDSRMRSFRFIDKELREVSTKLRAYCRKHYKKDYYLLRSVPGIGGIVACGLLCELGDLRRFKNFKQLASYVGLIPSVRQSGDNRTTSGLSPRANRLMRSYLVEATWQALRFDPVMQAYYRSHSGKDVKRILIKVARKLLSRIHAVIRTGIPYEIGVVS